MLSGKRLVLLLLICLTGWAHWRFGLESWSARISHTQSTGFVTQAVFDHPAVLKDLLLQAGVILLMYGLAFTAIWKLSAAGGNGKSWYQRPAALLALTWTTSCWLILRLHNYLFRQSAWIGLLDTDLAPAASIAMDLMCAAWLLWRLYRCAKESARPSVVVLVAVAVIGLMSWLAIPPLGGPQAKDKQPFGSQPNVIVIGLDSIRRDTMLRGLPSEIPNIAAFRDEAFIQSNVITPLARTFPSWVTILTGLHPRASRARENHAPSQNIDSRASIAWALQRAGYRTVYATDETRFSNIGRDFGFQQVIAPKPGVADFLLGEFGDLPLVNLALQLRHMEWLLPSMVANRADSQAYRPARFIQRVADALGPAEGAPTFLAIHLCTVHWPFYVADLEIERSGEGWSYQTATRVLDRQFGQLRQTLERLGYWTANTTVVVLADHGEGPIRPLDPPFQTVYHQTTINLGPPMGGHGATILEPSQWQIAAMFAGRGVKGAISAGESDQLASLEDLAPTIAALSGLEPAMGQPLDAAKSADARKASGSVRPIVKMETGFRTGGLDLAAPDKSKALKVAVGNYAIASDGKVELTPAAYEDAIATKDIGITDGEHSLVAIWQPDGWAMVASNFAANRRDVFPGSRSPNMPIPPLLNSACTDDEFRSRLPEWCQ